MNFKKVTLISGKTVNLPFPEDMEEAKNGTFLSPNLEGRMVVCVWSLDGVCNFTIWHKVGRKYKLGQLLGISTAIPK